MLLQIFIGSIVMIATVIIHAGGMAVGLRWLIIAHDHQLELRPILVRSLVVGMLVFIIFVATLLEAWIWALTYLYLDVLTDYESALYFSMVTYTTLGYGDVVLEQDWRLLSSIQAANGIIIFGWTTALLIVAIHRFSRTLKKIYAWEDEK